MIIARFYAHRPQSHALTCVSYIFLEVYNKRNLKFCSFELELPLLEIRKRLDCSFQKGE